MKEQRGNTKSATLGNEPGFTVFKYGGRTIRFRAPYSLERYIKVKKWDRGYLVVDAKYAHKPDAEEEYIDLIPILEDLYINPQEFVSPIESVTIDHG